MSEIISYVDDYSKSGLVFLDACRNNPFGNNIQNGVARGLVQLSRSIGQLPFRRGLERVSDESTILSSDLRIGTGLAEIDGGVGMFIAFATRPGKVALDGYGSHSPFTEGLLKYLVVPEMDIKDTLQNVRKYVAKITRGKQIPWDASSLIENVYLQRNAKLDVSNPIEVKTRKPIKNRRKVSQQRIARLDSRRPRVKARTPAKKRKIVSRQKNTTSSGSAKKSRKMMFLP
jgi:hypothetical protein